MLPSLADAPAPGVDLAPIDDLGAVNFGYTAGEWALRHSARMKSRASRG